MEEKTTFVDETDYKRLWKYELDKIKALEAQIQNLNDEIDRWQHEVENLNDAANKLEAQIEERDRKLTEANNVIQYQRGELSAFRYCVENWGVGG